MDSFDRALERINARIGACETRYGLRRTTLGLALLLIVAGALYAGVSFVPFSYGVNFARVSVNPFNFDRPDEVQYRILGPLIGYALHLRGNLFPLVTHAASVMLLATLYLGCRRDHWKPVEALALTALMGFSFPVLNELHGAGRVDPLSYLFLLWAMLAIRRPVVWGGCFALALLTHEGNAFALPGLFMLRFLWPVRRRDVMAHSAAAVLAFAPWLVVRLALQAAISSSLPYSVESYLTLANVHTTLALIVGTVWVGAFGAFKLGWCIPLYAVAVLWVGGADRRRAALIALMIAGPAAQCLIAMDVTRMLCLAFPAVLLGAQALRARWGGARFARRVAMLFLLNLLIPTIGVGGERMAVYHPLPYVMLVQWLFGVPI